MSLRAQGVMFKADQERELRFTTNALCRLEDKLGYSVLKLEDNAGFKTLRIIFQCGLLGRIVHYQKKMSEISWMKR